MSIWSDHRDAYERTIKAKEAQIAADIELQEARKAVIAYVAEKLTDDPEIDIRSLDDGDPLMDYVKAAESRYAHTLGQYQPRKPLQIEIINPSDYSAPLAEALTVLAAATGEGPNAAAGVVADYEAAAKEDSQPPLDTNEAVQ
jgi:hypothetical protein